MLHNFIISIVFIVLVTSCNLPVQTSDPVPSRKPLAVATNTPKIDPMEEIVNEVNRSAAPTASILPPPTLTAQPTEASEGKPVYISADDARIRYNGRFDFSDPQHPIYDWSGITIEAAFSGSSLSIVLKDGFNFYNVTVDGHSEILQTIPEETTYIVAQDLPDEPHVIRLTKRTEAYVGAGVFSGLILEAGHDLLEKPAHAERYIEFVGDSITTGYGNEGDSPTCWFTAGTQNVAQSFAGQTADHFNADYSIVALSGLGVVRNLRSAEASSPETAVDFLDRSLAMNHVLTWDQQNRFPDAVVVNLGTNDFSSLPFPEVEPFVEGYVELLQQIRLRYPQAPVFALAGPLMLEPAPEVIRTAVERMSLMGNSQNVHFVLIEDTLDKSAVDFGCDWHPNVHGHRKIAEQLVPVMADVLDW